MMRAALQSDSIDPCAGGQHDLTARAKTLVERTVGIVTRQRRIIIHAGVVGQSHDNDLAVGLEQSIAGHVPIAAKIGERVTVSAE